MQKSTYLSVEQAVQVLIQNTVMHGETQNMPLIKAVGYIAAEDVFACINQPPFNRSPLDGYAVNHKDIQNGSVNTPVKLQVCQHIYAGDSPKKHLLPGEAAMVMTGAPIPLGATCVVRQEDTDEGRSTISIFTSLGEYENYCWLGEDVKKGQQLIKIGQQLDSANIAVLAGQGYTQVKVYRRPRIGVLSTGSELVSAGTPLTGGKIYDSNNYYIASRVSLILGESVFGGKVEDNPESITLSINDLLAKCDMVITTGGVSVGAHDYMPIVGEMLGAQKLFHGIEMKPGGPALALLVDKKLVLCLSGNPFAVAATFEMLARPAIEKISGATSSNCSRISGVLDDNFKKHSPSRRFIRAKIVGNKVYLPHSGHSSGVLSTMAGCNCLVDIPAGTQNLLAGTLVDIVLI